MVNLFYGLFFLVLTSPLIGGEVSSSVNLSEGTLDDEFVLSVVVEGSSVSTPQVPSSYQGIQFQSLGRSSSYTNYNGVTKSNVTYNYRMSFDKAGTYTVPSIAVKVDADIQKTMPIRVKVLAPSNAVSDASGNQQAPIYIKRSLDKTQVYMGDYIVSKVKIYSRIPLRTSGYEYVKTPGFQTKEIKGARRSSKVINGVTYSIYEISAILIPTKVGQFSVAPYKLSVVMPNTQKKKRRRGDPFDDFFDDRMMQDFFGRRRAQKVLSSNRIDVKVLDLPTTKQPADFSGIVGGLKVSVKTPKGTLKTGENINVDVELFGELRLDGIALDGVQLHPSFKVYPSEGKGDDQYHHNGVRGKRIFSFGVVPTKPGKIDMGTLQVSYFDPKSKSYKRTTKPLGVFQVSGKNLTETNDKPVAVSENNKPNTPAVKAPNKFQKMSQSELDKVAGSMSSWASLRSWLPYVALGFPLFVLFLFGANQWGSGLRRRLVQKNSTSATWKTFTAQWQQAKKSQDPHDFYAVSSNFLAEFTGNEVATKNYFELQEFLRKKGFDSSKELVTHLKGLDKILYGQGDVAALDQITSGLYNQLQKLHDHMNLKKGL